MSDTPNDNNALRLVAMNYLARREHGRAELFTKIMKTRQPEADVLNAVLDKLEQDDLLNEQRFLESFIRMKANAGNGPLKIHYELKNKGIEQPPIGEVAEALGIDWFAVAEEVYHKKYGEETSANGILELKEKAKRLRFLAQRGFTSEQSYALF